MSELNTLTKDQQIVNLKAELEAVKQRQKYGLIWEDHPEALDNKNVIPLLDKRDDLSLPYINGKPDNYLIEGDNYKEQMHSLEGWVLVNFK